jgi:hypothetical protein
VQFGAEFIETVSIELLHRIKFAFFILSRLVLQ